MGDPGDERGPLARGIVGWQEDDLKALLESTVNKRGE